VSIVVVLLYGWKWILILKVLYTFWHGMRPTHIVVEPHTHATMSRCLRCVSDASRPDRVDLLITEREGNATLVGASPHLFRFGKGRSTEPPNSVLNHNRSSKQPRRLCSSRRSRRVRMRPSVRVVCGSITIVNVKLGIS
jgi:hypothetical protein